MALYQSIADQYLGLWHHMFQSWYLLVQCLLLQCGMHVLTVFLGYRTGGQCWWCSTSYFWSLGIWSTTDRSIPCIQWVGRFHLVHWVQSNLSHLQNLAKWLQLWCAGGDRCLFFFQVEKFWIQLLSRNVWFFFVVLWWWFSLQWETWLNVMSQQDVLGLTWAGLRRATKGVCWVITTKVNCGLYANIQGQEYKG